MFLRGCKLAFPSAGHCWFPPAVSGLSHVTVGFHLPFPVCRRRRTSSDVVIEEEELVTCRSHSFFFSIFLFSHLLLLLFLATKMSLE